MKTFATYYFETDKTYQFKVKLAGVEPTKETMDRIKNAVDVYQVESMGKAKPYTNQRTARVPQTRSC